MIREIVKDTEILQQVSKAVKPKEAKQVIQDLLDTAQEHNERCVGLSAIQIPEDELDAVKLFKVNRTRERIQNSN